MSSHDHAHYEPWRMSRIAKLEQVFGKEYFRDKTVLECGAGTGLVGKFLREKWGANVAFTEGRPELINKISENNPGALVYQVNHEKSWYVGQFDFIIHWGLLYHLDKWREDIAHTINNMVSGGVLTLESEILDYDTDQEIKLAEPIAWDDQAMDGTATRMTAVSVEEEFRKLGITFNRYDDADLNADFHHYDWKITNSGKYGTGQRRFWICYT